MLIRSRTGIPEELLEVIDEIDARGSAELTKLTVLKRWFALSRRLAAFALWVAARASSRKGKTRRPAAELFREARALLGGLHNVRPKPDRRKARRLHDRLRAFQNEREQQRWGPVRVIRNWNLMLVEEGLAVYLWHSDSPAQGYKLAADYCQHYDPRYGKGLSGPSRTKILGIVRFMFTIEALEDDTL